MKISVDMLTSVEATEEKMTSALSTGTSARVIGKTLIARIVPPTVAVPRPYHSLGLPTVSTSGAHKTFQVCGNTDRAISVAIIAVGKPARASKKPIVTPT